MSFYVTYMLSEAKWLYNTNKSLVLVVFLCSICTIYVFLLFSCPRLFFQLLECVCIYFVFCAYAASDVRIVEGLLSGSLDQELN